MSAKTKTSKTAKSASIPVGKAAKDPAAVKTALSVAKKAHESLIRLRALKAATDGTDTKLDTKVLDQQVEALRGQISVARTALSTIKDGLEIRLPVSFDMKTNSSGLLSAVQAFDPTASTEWSSLSALFDEYTMYSADFHLNVTAAGPTYGSGVGNDSAFAVFAHDAAEGTPLTSVRNGMEIQHHMLIGAPATNGALTTQFSSGPYRFHCVPPKGVLAAINSNVQYLAAGEWVPTISTQNTLYWGYLKTYFQTAYTSALPAVQGIVVYRCAFRCRT